MLGNKTITMSAFAIAALFLIGPLTLSVNAGGQNLVHIQVVDFPRPVSAAVLQIERHFGWVVTYEDTRYVYPPDIVDITAEIRRDYTRSTRVFGRRKANLELAYTPRPGSVESQTGEVLRALVARSNAAGTFGEFRVQHAHGGYHVVPVAIKGQHGRMEPYTSPLDTRITIMAEDENGLEFMLRLASIITAYSGSTVNPGTMPLNRFDRARVTINAQNDVARDVLWQVLQSIGSDLSWQLLCDVGEDASCAINVHPVARK